MKSNILIKVSAMAVVLSLSVVGCRKGLDKTTPLPGLKGGPVSGPGPSDPIGGNNNDTTGIKPDDGTSKPIAVAPLADPNKSIALNPELSKWGAAADADQIFKKDTVYFDYDKSTLRPSEVPKVERVASGIKGLAGKALRIEGHCDERGTEEYNRSLGERRALAVREALVRAGADPNLIDTISFGEDRPVDPGHNEAAWKKNRRGEFIVIEPPTASTSK